MVTISLIFIVMMTMVAVNPASGKFDLTPTILSNNGLRYCTTKNNENGLCVPPHTCNENQEIVLHGRIFEENLRSLSECIPNKEWCCVLPPEKTAPRSTKKPTEKPSEKPTERPTDRPTGRPTEIPTDRPTGRPIERPTNRPTYRPTERPTERPTGRPTERLTEKPTDRLTGRPVERPTERPIGRSTERSTGRPLEKLTERPTDRPTGRPLKKLTERPTGRPTGRPSGRPIERPTERPTERPIERPTERPTGRPTERPTDRPTGRSTERPTENSTKRPDKKPKCAVSSGMDCPWCVKLYRDGEIYCMGSMLGSSVILTSATCVVQGEGSQVTARVHGATDPEKDYVVRFKISHPDFNSGTRFHDVGLMMTDDVQWGSGGNGACYSTAPLFDNLCIGTGVDYDDNLYLTTVKVTEGSCFGKRGNVAGTMCGTLHQGICHMKPGAPVMCLDGQASKYVMKGITKMTCIKDKVMIENLNNSAAWLMNTLQGTMFLKEEDYLFNLNYQ